MSFQRISDKRKLRIATQGLQFCKQQFGKVGLKVEQQIVGEIHWQPTFFIKPKPHLLCAFEVSETLLPEALRGAAHDVTLYDFPVSIYQISSLEAFQTDKRQRGVNELREHGFGLITVDEDGSSRMQFRCVPLAQHVSNKELERQIAGLAQQTKVKYREAYDVYCTNEGQGLQDGGQIVEAIINALVIASVRVGKLPGSTLGDVLAYKIDALYEQFGNHRAALGGARAFTKEFRNLASHAPKNAAQASEKIRKCRSGFLDSIKIAGQLTEMAASEKLRVRYHFS